MKYQALILLIINLVNAQNYTIQITRHDHSKIDSLINYMGKFVIDPLNYCTVTPVGFTDMADMGGSKYGYISLVIETECDGREVHAELIKSFNKALGKFTRSTGGWDGIIGAPETMAYFISGMNKKYPWIRASWRQSECLFVIYAHSHYGGGTDSKAHIFFRVRANGVLLTDEIHPRMNEYSHKDIVRIGSPIMIGAVYVAPVDTNGMHPSTHGRSYTEVHFAVPRETLNKITKNASSVRIDIERIYNVNTKSTSHYVFAGQYPYF